MKKNYVVLKTVSKLTKISSQALTKEDAEYQKTVLEIIDNGSTEYELYKYPGNDKYPVFNAIDPNCDKTKKEYSLKIGDNTLYVRCTYLANSDPIIKNTLPSLSWYKQFELFIADKEDHDYTIETAPKELIPYYERYGEYHSLSFVPANILNDIFNTLKEL